MDVGDAGLVSDAIADSADAPVDALPDVSVLGNGSEAVGFHIDPAHSGSQPNDTLTLPLLPMWSTTLSLTVSYALVAGGRVFVTVANTSDATDLFALDEASGAVLWGPRALGGQTAWSNAAYDNGRVFTVDAAGTAASWDAVTGDLAWSVPLGGTVQFITAPTAVGGVLYFVGDYAGLPGGMTLYALDESSGKTLWKGANGSNEPGFTILPPPAVANGDVFYEFVGVTTVFTTTGTLSWLYGVCDAMSLMPAVFAGDLYTSGDCGEGAVLDLTAKDVIGSFVATAVPAFSKDAVYYVNGETLSAFPLPQGGDPDAAQAPLWTFTGDGTIASEPVVVGSTVVVGGTSGQLWVLDAATGTQVGGANVGGPIQTDQGQHSTTPWSALAAADNHLFVPTGNTLVAF